MSNFVETEAHPLIVKGFADQVSPFGRDVIILFSKYLPPLQKKIFMSDYEAAVLKGGGKGVGRGIIKKGVENFCFPNHNQFSFDIARTLKTIVF